MWQRCSFSKAVELTRYRSPPIVYSTAPEASAAALAATAKAARSADEAVATAERRAALAAQPAAIQPDAEPAIEPAAAAIEPAAAIESDAVAAAAAAAAASAAEVAVTAAAGGKRCLDDTDDDEIDEMEAIRAVQDRVKRARQENAPSASGSASTPPASTAGLPESSAAPDVSQPAAALADPDTPATPTSSDVLSLSKASGGALEADAEPGGFSVGDESGDEGSCGYDSDEEATMTVVRSAFLVHGAERAAYGEFRPSDGVFAVESVVDGFAAFDVAGRCEIRCPAPAHKRPPFPQESSSPHRPLGSVVGGFVTFDDLSLADLDFQWNGPPAQPGSKSAHAPEASVASADVQMDAETEPVEMMSTGEASVQTDLRALPSTSTAECQTSPTSTRWRPDAADVRVRVDVTDPLDRRKTKLVSLPQLLDDCARKRERPPILTPMDRLAKQQRLGGAYKSRAAEAQAQTKLAQAQNEQQQQQHFEELAEQQLEHEMEMDGALAQQQAELEGLRQQVQAHPAQLAAAVQAAREDERARLHRDAQIQADGIAAWATIHRKMGAREAEERLQHAKMAHSKELATRSKRIAKWTRKRNHASRKHQREVAARELAEEEAQSSKADALAMQQDNDALHAELGERFRVAKQRQHDGARTAFTYQTVLRDLRVRQNSLNSGAKNVRRVTKVFSQLITADGSAQPTQTSSLSDRSLILVCLLL